MEQYGCYSLLRLLWFYFLLSDPVIQRQHSNFLFLLCNNSYYIEILSLKKLVCPSRCNNKLTTFMMNFLPSSCSSPKLLETEKYTIIFISNSPCLLDISISGFILIYLSIIIAYNLLRHMRHATLFGTIYYKIALA